MLQGLAALIRDRLESLVDQYDARLCVIPAYATLPESIRRELERTVLAAMADGLDTGDATDLIHYVQLRARQWVGLGFDVESFQQAVAIPEELLVPLIDSVEASTFMWRTFNNVQNQVWQLAAERVYKAEQEIRRLAELQTAILDNAGYAVISTDTEGVITTFNLTAERMLGYSAHEVVGEVTSAIFHDRDEVTERARLFSAELGIPIEPGFEVFVAKARRNWPNEYEWTYVRKDGSRFPVLLSVTALRDSHGNIVGFLGMANDITERQQAADELRAARQQLLNIIDFLPDATFVIDQDKKVIAWNRAIEEMTGVRKEDILGQGDYAYAIPFYGQRRPIMIDLIEAEDPEFRSKYENVHKQGNTLYAEVFVPSVFGGRGADLWVTASPLLDSGGSRVGAIESIRDITERKRLERQIHESLERRGRQVQTSTEVAQEIATAPALDELFRRVVMLIKERFGYYHAQLFRYEPALNALVLVTGYGEAGEKMLAAGHRLALGRGVVGTAAATGQPVLATDVRQDEDWRPNPNLPETKGELAVPITLRDQVLGILDVQSDQVGALTLDDQLLLEGLCGQIAIAMESTRLLEELRANEAELSDALRIARMGYWEYDVERDLFTFNDHFYAIFHTTAEQEGGYTMSSARYAQKFVHPDDAAVVGTEIQRALASTDQHYVRELDHRILYADGGVGYITVRLHIERDAQGRILRYYGANEDITERKQAEEAIKEEQQRTRTILETVTVPMIISRLSDSRVLYANQALSQIGHIALEELIGGRTVDYFANRDDRQKVADALQRQGYVNDFETQLRRGDGVLYWVLLSARIINYQNETCVLTSYIDITERKQAEAQTEETLRELEHLYSAVSREGWQAYRESGTLPTGYVFDRTTTRPAEHVWAPELEQAIRQQAFVAPHSTDRSAAVAPLSVRGEIIGALGVYDEPGRPLSPDDLELVASVSEQVALALESARLFEQTQLALGESRRLARREELINRISGKIRASVSVDDVLRIAVDELRQATGTTRAVVELNLSARAGSESRSGNGHKE